MDLLTNETELMRHEYIVLTNFRLLCEVPGNSNHYKHNMVLKNISATEYVYKRSYKYLIHFFVCIALCFVSYYISQEGDYIVHNIGMICIILFGGLCFWFLWLLINDVKRGIIVYSYGSNYYLPLQSNKYETFSFMDNIDAAVINSK